MEPELFSKKNIINTIIGVILILICYYILFHVVNEKKGIGAFFDLSQELEQKQKELNVLKNKRIELEHNVKSMRSDSLDLDLLEEQVRKNLGLVSPDEAIYFMDEHNKFIKQ